ncbi:MAG TPA: HRDC domain-containing protein, partial [Marivita sp.]|nr:HRDC domain-containing protein [Marivita sp.]
TDWSRRPLSDSQKVYALADVTHLRVIYEFLRKRLEETSRDKWVEEEIATLLAPETYVTQPEDAWMRVKTRSNAPRFLAIVKELAKFREAYAQDRNVPRSRVYKDDALVELASTKPKDMTDLSRSRLLLREARKGDIADGILKAVHRAQSLPKEQLPEVDTARQSPQVNPALADLLRVLLKAKTEASGVASKLIASAAELDALAAGNRDVPALSGWRREVFGEDALRLCDGRVGLAAKGKQVQIIEI